MKDDTPDLDPALVLRAYAAGIFPMAEGREDPEIFWVDPRRRAIIPLEAFHISRSLARRLRRDEYAVTVDRAFSEVVAGCADRPETWISHRIAALMGELHALGHAHSIEVWDGGDLIGGVYGVALGGLFAGESMFSRRTDASKVALAYLVDRLRRGGFRLFDVQFMTPHLKSLGAVELSRAAYRERLAEALQVRGDFLEPTMPASGQEIVQRSSQTS